MISKKSSRGGVKYFILLFCFIFLSFFVRSETIYDITILDNFQTYEPFNCHSSYKGAAIANGSCTIIYDNASGSSIFPNNAAFFSGTHTINMTDAMPIMNFFQLQTCNRNFPSVGGFNVSLCDIDGSDCVFAGSWVSSVQSTCETGAGCATNKTWENITFSNTNNKRQIKIEAQPKQCTFTGLYRYDIFEVNLSYINLSVNDLPTIDTFDYNLSECWAENTTSLEIALTINATDPENNQIYFALDNLNYLLRYSVNREDFEENGQPDLDFFTRGNYVSNNTYPESQQENSDFVAFNFDWVVNGQNLKHGIGAIGSNNYLLTRLEDAGAFYYQVDEPLINASFIDFELAFPSVENGLDYILFDSFGNRLINISFHLNESEALKIYQDGVLNKTVQFSNFHSGNYTGYIFVVNLFTNNGLTILLQDQDFIINETLHKSVDIQDFDRVGFFTHNRAMQSYDDYSPVWIMGNLIVNGWNYNPSIDWTATKPTSIQVNDSDLIVVKLYVTDELHKNSSQYNYKLLPINLQFCAYHVEPIGSDNIVGIFGGMTRNAVVDYLNAIGLYELGRKVVWLFFFFILIGMIAAEYMMLRRVDFTFPLIAASGICMLMSLAALYVTEIIAFGLLLAFSLAAPLAIHFLSGETGRT